MKLNQAAEYPTDPDLTQSPQVSLFKREPAQFSPHMSGVKSPLKQEPSNRKVIRSFPDVSPRDQRRAFNYITMGRFWINPTTIRSRVFTWLLLLSIKMVSILTAAVFWLATVSLIISMFAWGGQVWILCYALKYIGGPPADTLWRHICLGTTNRGPHLRLAVHASNYVNSQVICSISIQILQDHSFFWLFAMAFMFISHWFACFAHDCVSSLKHDNT
jgi:hypothetical protein